MATQNYILIHFKTDKDEKVALRVGNPKPDGTMSVEQMKTAMNKIVGANAIVKYNITKDEFSHLTSANKVQYITSNKTDIAIV